MKRKSREQRSGESAERKVWGLRSRAHDWSNQACPHVCPQACPQAHPLARVRGRRIRTPSTVAGSPFSLMKPIPASAAGRIVCATARQARQSVESAQSGLGLGRVPYPGQRRGRGRGRGRSGAEWWGARAS